MARDLINEIIRGELGEIANLDNLNSPNILNPAVIAAVEDLGNPRRHVMENLLNQRGEKRPHNVGYFENTVPLYDVSEFKSHFRMKPQTMQLLCADVARRYPQVRKMEIPLEKKVMFTVWMLSKPETFLAAGDRFNFSKSTAHLILSDIVGNIAEGIDDHIKWSSRQQQQYSKVFEERSGGFEGIIGAIDGCHIQIKKPEGNDHDYYNRKQVHSIILQGICNENCKFINVSTGYPGRRHDARVFRNSPIGQMLEENQDRLIAPDHYLIEDAAYGLSTYLLTPFRDTGHLNNIQTNYNKKLSSVRSVIERAFGRLKGKFRRLKLLELNNLELITKTVLASCVIHNIILDNDGLSDEEYSDDEDNPPQPEFVNMGNNVRGKEIEIELLLICPDSGKLLVRYGIDINSKDIFCKFGR